MDSYSLRSCGRHLQIELTTQKEKGEIALPIDLMVVKELTVIGSLGMPPPRYKNMLAMIVSGKLKPGSLLTQTVAIEEASDVLFAMNNYTTTGINVIDRW